jgi:outer membrane lipase/esterase
MLRMYFRVPLLWLLVLLSFSARSSLAAPVQINHMVVFGDSLSDNGNLYSILHLPAPPTYALGRSTDGPDTYPASAISGMWEEQLAPWLGLPVPQPNLVNAADLNFAFAGAETGESANSVTGPYGMAAQVQSYLGQKPANIATALHLFWGGTNDLFDYPDPLSAEQNAVLNISNQIASIAAAGGQNFVWLICRHLTSVHAGREVRR